MDKLEDKDIIFEDDLDTGETTEEISGYMWATDALVKRAGWEPVIDGDQINFYPTYNTRNRDFRLIVCSYTNGRHMEEFLSLEKEEVDLILTGFLRYCSLLNAERYWPQLLSDPAYIKAVS